MKIALFDYIVTQDNAIGKCDLGILAALCHEHEFTVFAVQFENPCPESIRWVRIPAPKRPLALLYLAFHVLAPICYVWHCLRFGVRFDSVQIIESNLSFGNIAYSHFCHRAFLERHWNEVAVGGLRGALRWLDHWLHARLEPWVYRRASVIVTPSHGLAREVAAAYPRAAAKIRVLANPVDLQSLRRSETFDRESFRKNLELMPLDIALAFVALGHYERKGLLLLLQALAALQDPRLKILVVGGSGNAISDYRERATRIGLNGNVKFFATQRDVRPYLWAADALALPSCYEVFPLVALEAAAAGLPLLVTRLNGVEEFLRDAENGLLMRRDVNAVSECIAKFAQMPLDARRRMGRRAQADVECYGMAQFASAWSQLYAEAGTHGR
jgi:glycosyltransferase involved in cell wall biosynthesis